jgi:hypothetical protein
MHDSPGWCIDTGQVGVSTLVDQLPLPQAIGKSVHQVKGLGCGAKGLTWWTGARESLRGRGPILLDLGDLERW